MDGIRYTVFGVGAAYLAVLAIVLQLAIGHRDARWYAWVSLGLLLTVLVCGLGAAWLLARAPSAIDLAPEATPQRLWVFTAFSLLFPVFVLVALLTWSNASPSGSREAATRGSEAAPGRGTPAAPVHYGAIIDAGSSGSRIAIFEWRIAGDGDPHVWPVVTVADTDVPRKPRDPDATGPDTAGECPLTSLPSDSHHVCNCLHELTTIARSQAARFLGEPSLPPIDLWVKATAGVRYEEEETRRKVLAATEQCFARPAKVDGFEWKNAQVISGAEEGMYAWLAVNHAARTLRNDVASTLGIVEVGGRSAQIAFRVAQSSLVGGPGEILSVPLKSGALHIYALSQELGQNAASKAITKQIVDRECGLGGNTDKCLARIDKFICPSPTDTICTGRRPALAPPSGMQFAGLSNFAYATANMGLAGLTLATVRDRATEICPSSYGEQLRDRHLKRGGKQISQAALEKMGAKLREEFVRPAGKYKTGACFSALYVAQIAALAWTVPLETISPPRAEWVSDPSWPLGSMIFEVLRIQGDAR